MYSSGNTDRIQSELVHKPFTNRILIIRVLFSCIRAVEDGFALSPNAAYPRKRVDPTQTGALKPIARAQRVRIGVLGGGRESYEVGLSIPSHRPTCALVF